MSARADHSGNNHYDNFRNLIRRVASGVAMQTPMASLDMISGMVENLMISRPLGMVSESTMKMATAFLATPLALLGWEFRPLTQAQAKKVHFFFTDFICICVGLCG